MNTDTRAQTPSIADVFDTLADMAETAHAACDLESDTDCHAEQYGDGNAEEHEILRAVEHYAPIVKAAPALLAALEAAKNVLQSYHEHCDWTDSACYDGGIDLDEGHAAIMDALAAIAQARGDA